MQHKSQFSVAMSGICVKLPLSERETGSTSSGYTPTNKKTVGSPMSALNDPFNFPVGAW